MHGGEVSAFVGKASLTWLCSVVGATAFAPCHVHRACTPLLVAKTQGSLVQQRAKNHGRTRAPTTTPHLDNHGGGGLHWESGTAMYYRIKISLNICIWVRGFAKSTHDTIKITERKYSLCKAPPLFIYACDVGQRRKHTAVGHV